MGKKLIALKPFNNKIFYKNGIFNELSATGSYYLIAARKLLAKNDIQMETIDLIGNQNTEKDIYMDIPYPWNIGLWTRILKNREKNILFILETPIINPFNFIKIFHLFFTNVYTWNDNYVDNKKYFKFFLPKRTEYKKIKELPFDEKKLLVMMNGNSLPFLPYKLLSLPIKELYTERIKTLNFFYSRCPDDISLYGRGWNKPQRFSIQQRLFGYKKYAIYKGEFNPDNKNKILSKFKFCICFENNEITGYISEKIFDCFKAKCVPIYRGAPNIDNFIRKECYIDARKFKNYQELYNFIVNMKEDKYNSYIKNIKALLEEKKFQDRWFENGFADLFLKVVKNP